MSGGDADGVEGFRREFDRLYIQPEVLAREQFDPIYNQMDLKPHESSTSYSACSACLCWWPASLCQQTVSCNIL
ncbi:unnamed protein product [Urochloa humidicola]